MTSQVLSLKGMKKLKGCMGEASRAEGKRMSCSNKMKFYLHFVLWCESRAVSALVESCSFPFNLGFILENKSDADSMVASVSYMCPSNSQSLLVSALFAHSESCAVIPTALKKNR